MATTPDTLKAFEAYKKAIHTAARANATAAASGKQWHTVIMPNAQAAVDFVNEDPAQGAGEAVFSDRSDGSVDVYYYL